MKRGAWAAVGAYTLWGLLPVYWKTIDHVPAREILSHRIVWTWAFSLLLLIARGNWRWLQTVRVDARVLRPFAVTALLLGLNWLTYIWANNNGHMVEASLGYFITPLVNVLLGLIFLRERLRPGQWLAIGIAALGALYLIVTVSGLLWISFALALTFSFYALLRKTAQLGALEGLAIEMSILSGPALAFLLSLAARGNAAFAHDGAETTGLLALAGVVTATPLLLFTYGAQRVTMTMLGILQYVAPTLQFLIGVLIYHESFSQSRLIGFSIIWMALAIYTAEGIVQRRRQAQVAAVS